MRAGQNLEDSAVFRAQEHHGPVFGQSSGNIDHNLGQFGSVRTKPNVRDEGEGSFRVFQWYLLEVLVKQGRSLTEGTASSIRGYVLMKVSISSGNWTEDLYSAAAPSPAHVPGLESRGTQNMERLLPKAASVPV